jgi:hypothetical protein
MLREQRLARGADVIAVRGARTVWEGTESEHGSLSVERHKAAWAHSGRSPLLLVLLNMMGRRRRSCAEPPMHLSHS